jgi:4-aminobutyrate aminotransferase/4-aminobutyrate aminotransferase/(S)-3-amino-2-methylpropionate transaminase
MCDERGILLFADEVLMGTGRSGKMWCMEHYDTQPDIMTIGKGFGNGFPVTAMLIREEYKDALEKISASTSYGGNPMACAAALACLEVIEEENICDKAAATGKAMLNRLEQIKQSHPIVGDVRGCGMYLGMELVKDRDTKEPFTDAGIMVYQKAFAKGLAWVPQNHILRLSPPILMDEDLAMKGLDLIEEAIDETEKHFGY